MKVSPLPKHFFKKPTLELAKSLLGCVLVNMTERGTTAGIIVETEAYIGSIDKAAHSYGGKRTPRTEIMFGEAGHAYVYLIYGIHVCFNVTSGRKGSPECVLIRALEPISGWVAMQERRGAKISKKNLCNGPGKLCSALGITLDNYGDPLFKKPLFIGQGYSVDESSISVGPRINIDYAEEAAEFPWRFWIAGNQYVSK